MLKTNGIGGLGLGRSTIVKKGVESIGIKVRPTRNCKATRFLDEDRRQNHPKRRGPEGQREREEVGELKWVCLGGALFPLPGRSLVTWRTGLKEAGVT
jgi:hypothetical protein